MKLLLVHDGHAFGGLERVMIESCAHLAPRCEVAVLVRGDGFAIPSDPTFVSALRTTGVEVVEVRPRPRRGRIGDTAERLRATIGAMRRTAPDVVHIHTVKVEGGRPAVVGARLARAKRVVRTEHNSPWAFSREPFRSSRRRLMDRLVDVVVTVSEADRDTQIEMVGRAPQKVQCIHNGVDTGRFDPSAVDGDRGRFGLPQHAFVVGSAGRLAPQKDYATMIEAAAEVVRSGVDLHVAIAGTGSLADDLSALTGRLGIDDRVHLLGQVADIATFYASLDLGVMSSLHEGLSLAMLEMMSIGLPTVITDHPGLTEAAVDGVTSIVVPLTAPHELAVAIEELAHDEHRRASMGRAARQRAVESFSYERYADSLWDLYTNGR